MKISVVIPSLNSEQTIGQQLHALSSQQVDLWWEVVVADNGSIDHSVEVVKTHQAHMPRLRLIDASDRKGVSHARNAGARAALGHALLFCDADDAVAPGWLAAMAEALKINPFVACGYDFDMLNAPRMAKGRGNSQRNGLQRLNFIPFPYGGGGSLGVRRDIHVSVGGFDENMRYCEDIDYCQRIQHQGIPLTFVPDALVYCRYPSTLSSVYKQAKNWAQSEELLFKRYQKTRMNELWRWRAYVHDWVAHAKNIPRLLRTPEGRVVVAWRMGRQIGFLKGSLRYRVPPIIGC